MNVERFIDSFKVLLEEIYGYPPSEESQFKLFWEEVRARAEQYHAVRSPNIHVLTQMENDARLNEDVAKLVQKYNRLFYSTVSGLRTRFGNEEMHGL